MINQSSLVFSGHDDFDCKSGNLVRVFYIGTLVFLSLQIFINIFIIYTSMQGRQGRREGRKREGGRGREGEEEGGNGEGRGREGTLVFLSLQIFINIFITYTSMQGREREDSRHFLIMGTLPG